MRVVLLVLVAGCLTNSPYRDAEDALGDTDHRTRQEDGDFGAGPTHRPGQPCLVCHGAEHSPGGPVFELAGTVYRTLDDEVGLEDATVEVTDASGRTFEARTNIAGTFFVERDGDGGFEQDGEGELRLGYDLEYPLTVAVEFDGIRSEMRSQIWREGSCAHCHTKEEGPASVGRVFLEER